MNHSAQSAAPKQPFWRFALSSVSSSVVDLAAFQLLCIPFQAWLGDAVYIMAATIAARVLSSLVNYLLNYFLVFHSRAQHTRSATLYTTITVLKTLLSGVLVSVIAGWLGRCRSWPSRSRWTCCCSLSTICCKKSLSIDRPGRRPGPSFAATFLWR